MIWTEILIFLVVCAIGVVAHRLGREEGYKRGWFDGNQHATRAFLPPSHVTPYDHVKEGL